jgi:hypothetical protein
MANTKDLCKLRVVVLIYSLFLLFNLFHISFNGYILLILILSKVVLVIFFFCKVKDFERYVKLSQIIDWTNRAFSIILFILNTDINFI